MPIDVPLWNLVQENKRAVIGELLRQFDPSYGSEDPIYTPDGEWSYARFERWLVNSGVPYWPRLESGRLDIDSDAFRMMSHIPGVEGCTRCATASGSSSGRDCRSGLTGATGLRYFRSARRPAATRTRGARSTRTPACARSCCSRPTRSEPISIGAPRKSVSPLPPPMMPRLKAAYSGGESITRSRGCAASPTTRTRCAGRQQYPEVRNRMKPLQLGINYGMGVPSLARGLNRHPLIASAIIERHRREYPRFWQWRENMVETAMLERKIESVFGWPLRISTSPNIRTLYNFPMQSGGAEMLRLAAWRMCEAGIVPIMLIHDGILLEETDPERIEHAREIMLQAGRDVCDGFEIGVDTDQLLKGGARYYDKRPMAKKMWATIMNALKAVGAIPEREVA